MKVLINYKIKRLFLQIALCITIGTAAAVLFAAIKPERAMVFITICGLGMFGSVAFFLFRYFKEQNVLMENAIAQIRRYLNGDRETRIECCEEGELYRLFHEVNTLASILNAHARKEETSKEFLKNTISDISHQLKTPLAALNIYNGIIKEESKDLQAIYQFTELSEQELDRIETLVQNLLKITKLDAKTIVFEKRIENIAEMMAQINRQFTYRAKQEEKKFVLSGEESVMLSCDKNWILEAVGNLVKNAFDHTIKGNTICVEWRQCASLVQIVVKDDGCGIHPEDLYHIFKRFYRSRFSKDTTGVGLGLPLAKTIVEGHDGTIEVDSELGRGTTFTMNFLNPTKL